MTTLNESKMVEVFKTNISKRKQAKLIMANLSKAHPLAKINFDLDDCDKILRVEGSNICPDQIIELLNAGGYQCELLVE